MSITPDQFKALLDNVERGKGAKVAKSDKSAAKRSKYGNRKTESNGIKFDSAREAARYQDLKIQEFAGEISGLKLQPVYPIVINGVKVCKYKGDFEYVKKDGTVVTEDVKGMKTAIYRLKKKLMLACHGISILET